MRYISHCVAHMSDHVFMEVLAGVSFHSAHVMQYIFTRCGMYDHVSWRY